MQKPTSVETSNVDDCEKFSWQSFLRRNAARLSTEVFPLSRSALQEMNAGGDVHGEFTAHFTSHVVMVT